MVAREMEPHSALPNADEIRKCLLSVYDVLEARARREMADDPEGDKALQACKDFCAIAELINFFGTQLIAYEDIERESMGRNPTAN